MANVIDSISTEDKIKAYHKIIKELNNRLPKDVSFSLDYNDDDIFWVTGYQLSVLAAYTREARSWMYNGNGIHLTNMVMLVGSMDNKTGTNSQLRNELTRITLKFQLAAVNVNTTRIQNP